MQTKTPVPVTFCRFRGIMDCLASPRRPPASLLESLMPVRFKPVVAAVIALTFAVACHASAEEAEMVDSPIYESWAKCLPGTKVFQTAETNVGGQLLVTDITMELVEVKPDMAIVDVSFTVKINGQARSAPAKRNELMAKVKKGSEMLPGDLKGTFKEAGTETLTIAGVDYLCKVVEFSGEKISRNAQGRVQQRGRLWLSTDLPGAQARMESYVDVDVAGTPQQGTINIITASVEKK